MGGISGMTGNVTFSGVRMPKTITVAEFKSWIVSTIGGLPPNSSDMYHSVVSSGDGGYVAVGYHYSQSLKYNDAYIVKYDSNLNVITQGSLGSTLQEYYNTVCATNDGGYVVVGSQSAQGQGGNDALIVKYDSDLNVLIQKSLGGTSGEAYSSVIQTSDGGYVAVGNQSSQGQGSNDALIVKYDSNLNLVAQKGLGGSDYDSFSTIFQDSNGDLIVAGLQKSQTQGIYDVLIVKYDSDLNVISQKGLGGAENDYITCAFQTKDGGYLFAGYQSSQTSNTGVTSEVWFVKCNSDLNVVYQKGLDAQHIIKYMSETSDGGFVCAGRSRLWGSPAFIVKLDSNLDAISQKSLSNNHAITFEGGHLNNDSSLVIVGHRQNVVTEDDQQAEALIVRVPSDLSILEGTFQNHSGLEWTSSASITSTTPALAAYNTTLVETTPTLLETVTTLSESTPTLSATRSEKQ